MTETVVRVNELDKRLKLSELVRLGRDAECVETVGGMAYMIWACFFFLRAARVYIESLWVLQLQ